MFCTVRGLFERAIRIKEYRLSSKGFTDQGTSGMNFVVVCGKSGIDNRVTKEEAILWFQNTFQGIVRNTEK